MNFRHPGKLLSLILCVLIVTGSFIPVVIIAHGEGSVSFAPEYSAFSQSATVNGVTVTVEAEDGIFPTGALLSVTPLDSESEASVSGAVDQLRNASPVSSYSFDIKIIGADGAELQPKDQSKVKVSFATQEANNTCLEASVYHIDDSFAVNALPASVSDGSVVVETDGFSIYTVEFTYNGAQFVLEGDSFVRLDSLLASVGINGTVNSWEISNPLLFNIYHGDDTGVEYTENVEFTNGFSSDITEVPVDNENGSVLYMVALEPFNTVEWLNVTVDGIAYHIVVTDDYIDSNGDTVSVNGIVQGGNDHNFAKDMPLADIFIDENVVNMSPASRNASIPQMLGVYAGYSEFEFYNPTVYTANDNVFLSINVDEAARNGRPLYGSPTGLTVDGGGNRFYPGDIIQYTFSDGAMIVDPFSGDATKYDVVITYSNLNVTLDNRINYYAGYNLGLFAGNEICIGASKKDGRYTAGNSRYGLKFDINIKVVDKVTGQIIPGSFYFPMVDIDVKRASTTQNLYNSSQYNYYSEQVLLDTSTVDPASSVYIPGADFTGSGARMDTNMPYISTITNVGDDILFSPNISYVNIPQGTQNPARNDDFYTGFATLINNTGGGAKLTYWGSSAALNSSAGRSGINTFLLSGTSHINHLLVSSTDEGGTITTSRHGNHSGMLDDGSTLYPANEGEKVSLTVATGQTVVYTMVPLEGYHLKRVRVNESVANLDLATTDVTSEVTQITLPDGSIAYTYEFADIENDGAIFVEWERDPQKLKITKNTVGNAPGNFDFDVVLTKEFSVAADNKTVGDLYKAHPDDIVMYRVDMSNYAYRFQGHNNYDYRQAFGGNPGNGGWASTAGVKNMPSSVGDVVTNNGNVVLRLRNVVSDPNGNKKDMIVKLSSAEIERVAASQNIDQPLTIIGGMVGDLPAFYLAPYDASSTSSRPNPNGLLDLVNNNVEYDFDVLMNAEYFVAEPADGSSISYTPVQGTFDLTLSDVGLANGQQEIVTIDGNTVTADNSGKINITANAGGTHFTLKSSGYGGLIYLAGTSTNHTVTMSSGSNGKVQATTTGTWKANGSVPDEGMILNHGTYGIPAGKSVVYKLIPTEGYELDTVTVNGVDVSASAIEGDGFYFLTLPAVNNDITINATWKAGTTPHQEDTTVTETHYYNLTTGTHSAVPYTNTLSVSNGQTGEWVVPYGWDYSVSENVPSDWVLLSSSNTSGTIYEDDEKAVFTNILTKDLDVTKYTRHRNGTFKFRIELTSPYPECIIDTNSTGRGFIDNQDGTITYSPSASGILFSKVASSPDTWEFTLTTENFEKGITIDNIPYGFGYNIYEVDDSGNKVYSGGNVADYWQLASETYTYGTITENVPEDAEFMNIPLVDLTVQKIITGNMAYMSDTFSFTLNAPTLGGKTIKVNGNMFTMPANGVYTFSLGHNGTIVFGDIPVGTAYTVTENDANKDSYTTSAAITGDTVTGDGSVSEQNIPTGDVSSIYDSFISQSSTIAFTNAKNLVVDTSVTFNTSALLFIGIAAVMSGIFFLCIKRKKVEE